MANKQNVQLWIDGLLSNRFQQGKGRLKADGKYCCLGVACEVAKENGLKLEERVTQELDSDSDTGKTIEVSIFGGATSFLPVVVQEWLGISTSDPYIAEYFRATHANDNGNWTFEEIAEALKKAYLDEDVNNLAE